VRLRIEDRTWPVASVGASNLGVEPGKENHEGIHIARRLLISDVR